MSETTSNQPWRRGTIESAPPRDLAFYEKLTGVNREELKGKTVLDLGSNKDTLLDYGLKASDIDCKVVSLSPDFSDKQHQPPETRREKSVATLAQYLPFADGTFDYILDVGGPAVHASKPQEIKVWIPEVTRVLKANGKYVGLLNSLNAVTIMRINQRLIEQGHRAYYEKDLEQIPQNIIREIIIKHNK